MFWETLGIAGQIYFVVACIASGLLIIQIILTIIGVGADVDIDVDVSDSDLSGFGLFTVRGLVAFFALGGWMGVMSIILDLHWGWSIPIFFGSGTVGLFGVAFALKAMAKLQSSGNIVAERAIGMTAEVYLTIPKKGEGTGKINLVLQEKYIEGEAINSTEVEIKTGEFVKIIAVMGDKFIVEQLQEEKVDLPEGKSAEEEEY